MIDLWVPIIGTGLGPPQLRDPFRPDPGSLPLHHIIETAITTYLDPSHPSYPRPASLLCRITVPDHHAPLVTSATAPAPRDRAVAPISKLPRHPHRTWLLFQPAKQFFLATAAELADPGGILNHEARAALECALALAMERGLRHSHARTIARLLALPFPPRVN